MSSEGQRNSGEPAWDPSRSERDWDDLEQPPLLGKYGPDMSFLDAARSKVGVALKDKAPEGEGRTDYLKHQDFVVATDVTDWTAEDFLRWNAYRTERIRDAEVPQAVVQIGSTVVVPVAIKGQSDDAVNDSLQRAMLESGALSAMALQLHEDDFLSSGGDQVLEIRFRENQLMPVAQKLLVMLEQWYGADWQGRLGARGVAVPNLREAVPAQYLSLLDFEETDDEEVLNLRDQCFKRLQKRFAVERVGEERLSVRESRFESVSDDGQMTLLSVGNGYSVIGEEDGVELVKRILLDQFPDGAPEGYAEALHEALRLYAGIKNRKDSRQVLRECLGTDDLPLVENLEASLDQRAIEILQSISLDGARKQDWEDVVKRLKQISVPIVRTREALLSVDRRSVQYVDVRKVQAANVFRVTGEQLTHYPELVEKMERVIGKQYGEKFGIDSRKVIADFRRDVLGKSNLELKIALCHQNGEKFNLDEIDFDKVELLGFYARKDMPDGSRYIGWMMCNPDGPLPRLGLPIGLLEIYEDPENLERSYQTSFFPHVPTAPFAMEFGGVIIGANVKRDGLLDARKDIWFSECKLVGINGAQKKSLIAQCGDRCEWKSLESDDFDFSGLSAARIKIPEDGDWVLDQVAQGTIGDDKNVYRLVSVGKDWRDMVLVREQLSPIVSRAVDVMHENLRQLRHDG